MKATTFALILLSILTGTCLTSCIDDDFTTNPSHVLAFSTDTVAFDTVFTTIGTSTRSFRIYNPNKKSLNISSIKLADAEHSGFHINVDGMSGDNFTNVEIRGKDSLYVFVEANIDPANQDNPIFIVDSIVFVTNGIQQDVKLTAYGQDVIIKRGETFTTDTTIELRCWYKGNYKSRGRWKPPFKYEATDSTGSLQTCLTTISAGNGAVSVFIPKVSEIKYRTLMYEE